MTPIFEIFEKKSWHAHCFNPKHTKKREDELRGNFLRERESMRLSSVARNFILAATAMSAIASANAQFDFNYNDFEDQFDRDFRHGHHQHGNEMRIAERVGQTYGPGFSDLRVARLLKLRQYTGYELKKVILVAETQPQLGGHHGPIRDRRDLGRPGRRHGLVGEATLMIDGIPQGYPKMISRFKDRIVFDLDNHRNEIGRDLNRVKFELKGSIHVYRVAAVIEKKRGHGGKLQTVRQHVGQYHNQFNNLKVIQELGLRQHLGKNVVEVTVKAQEMSRRGRAQAQLLVNGRPEGFPQAVNHGKIHFQLSRGLTLGDEIRTIQVAFTKEVYVESVSATLKKKRGGMGRPGQGPGPRPLPGRRILDETLYVRVAGDKVMDLAQAMQATRSESNKQIQTVELVIKNSGMRGQIRLCKGQVVRGSAQCTDTQRLSFGRQTITLHGDRFLSLDQATIAARGDMIIESARVILQ